MVFPQGFVAATVLKTAALAIGASGDFRRDFLPLQESF